MEMTVFLSELLNLATPSTGPGDTQRTQKMHSVSLRFKT